VTCCTNWSENWHGGVDHARTENFTQSQNIDILQGRMLGDIF